MSDGVALVAGIGPGLGAAMAREFGRRGHAVAGIARSPAPSAIVAAALGGDVKRYRSADLADGAAVQAAVRSIAAEVGEIRVLVLNAAQLVVGGALETAPGDFEVAWRGSVLGAVHCAQAVLPSMLARGDGAMLFTGATASLRGGAGFAAFASAKFALRGLAQSLARELQPRGIHVAHVVLDGLMRGTPSVARFGGADERSLDPDAVARAFADLAGQHRAAWTHEIDLRPASERF